MRLYIILSDNDTWDGIENCSVVLAKEEHELTAEEMKEFNGEYHPGAFVVESVKLSDLTAEAF